MTEGIRIWPRGARVEVYDGDRGRWCPGTVQETGQTRMGLMVMVKSDHEFEEDLPLIWGVPFTESRQLIRRA
jgi:hypothetical protein